MLDKCITCVKISYREGDYKGQPFCTHHSKPHINLHPDEIHFCGHKPTLF